MKIYTVSYKAKRGGVPATAKVIANSKNEALMRAYDQLKAWYLTQVRVIAVVAEEELS